MVTPGLATEIAGYAQGVGPSKNLLKSSADVETFHKAGLVIHPYTFRGPTTANARKPLDEKLPDGLDRSRKHHRRHSALPRLRDRWRFHGTIQSYGKKPSAE